MWLSGLPQLRLIARDIVYDIIRDGDYSLGSPDLSKESVHFDYYYDGVSDDTGVQVTTNLPGEVVVGLMLRAAREQVNGSWSSHILSLRIPISPENSLASIILEDESRATAMLSSSVDGWCGNRDNYWG